MRRVLFFLNPLLMDRRNRRAVVTSLAGTLRKAGATVELQDTLSAHSAGEQAQEAVASGFDTIFVCGGDGTIFQVIQGIAGSETRLGIIPFGTGNVLAQNLHLPRQPARAMHAQMNAPAVPIPLGKITCKTAGHTKDRSWYFTIAAGMGVHAALMNLAPTGGGKRVGGRAAYFAGGFRLLVQHPVEPFDLELTLADGAIKRRRASEVIAVRVGAINLWRPGGDPLSSTLRVASLPETTRMGLAHASYHALVTKKDSSSPGRPYAGLPYPTYEEVTALTCHPIEGYSYQSPLLIEADGEVIGMKKATITMAQRRLNLLWPKDSH